MAYPASPYSRSFQNLNVCRSFNVSCTTTKAALTGEECSEVLVLNKTGQDVYIYDAGYHQIIWNANNNYSSGVYFVRMIAGDYINTQKVMLIK